MRRKCHVELIVPGTHPSLAGHFPGRPIVPGVVLLDLVCGAIQAAAPEPFRIQAISQAKFLRPVSPDTVVQLSATIEAAVTGYRASFSITLDGAIALEGVLALSSQQQEGAVVQ